MEKHKNDGVCYVSICSALVHSGPQHGMHACRSNSDNIRAHNSKEGWVQQGGGGVSEASSDIVGGFSSTSVAAAALEPDS